MNKTGEYRFTIVVPVYNEEDNIYALEKALSEFLPKSKCSSCVLFVNDGCRIYGRGPSDYSRRFQSSAGRNGGQEHDDRYQGES